jgi:hypothetical protein
VLKNISRIEINLLNPIENPNETILNLGPILIPKGLIKINLTELFNSSKYASQWIINLSGYDNYTLVMPNFLSLEDIKPITASVKIWPASIIFVKAKGKQNCTLLFRLASEDPRTLALKFMSRPLRHIVLYTANTTSSVSFLHESDIVLFGDKTLNVSLEAGQMCIIKAEDLCLENGKILLGVFVDSGIRSSNVAIIRVYKNFDDACSHRNFIVEFKVSDVQRWHLFESEFAELSTLYLRIDNLDLVRNFTIWIRVYSFGKYY